MPVYLRLILSCLLLHVHYVYGQGGNDTLKLYFELGNPTLSKNTTEKIASWIYNDRITGNKNILIIGYADHLGTDESNNTLSVNRAANVQTYLTEMGIPKANIKLLVGKGEIKRAIEKSDGYPSDRRVDIVMLSPSTTAAASKKTPAVKPPSATAFTPVPITTAKPGQTFVLDKIYFYSGRHFIREESMSELDNLYNTLVANPDIKIRIEGHVCCVRSVDALDEDTFEMALSVNRAKFIYEYLVRRGISRDRLSFRGFGRSRPVVEKELTEADENRNRRVEIRILQ